jgi:hypothetical protein
MRALLYTAGVAALLILAVPAGWRSVVNMHGFVMPGDVIEVPRRMF